MAVSCPEVMYGAYYPYLYGRAAPSRSFYQYERFNQDLYSSSGVPLASSSASGSSHSPCSPILPPTIVPSAQSHQTATPTVPTIPLGALHRHITKEEDLSAQRSDNEGPHSGAHNDSSCSSSPDSPHLGTGGGHPQSGSHHHSSQHLPHSATNPSLLLHPGQSNAQQQQSSSSASNQPATGPDQVQIDDSVGASSSSAGSTRAQYVSATCVVFTHYSGDTASVVDEHFSRALNFSNKDSKDGINPMTARNFPPSFWDSNYVPPTPAPTHPQMSDLYSTEGSYSTDPWVPHAAAAAHYGSYAAHAHAAYHHHHNMAQYSNLLRLPQQYGHSSRLHHDQQTAHALESAAAYSSYPTMAGLEAQVQESSKDLYWF